MNRVCILKSTGKLMEMQGGGKIDRAPESDFEDEGCDYQSYLDECDMIEAMRLNTLKQNALNAGYNEADIEVRWVTDAELYAIQNPPLTVEETKARKLAELAAYKYEKETAGITLPTGVKIRTDRESQNMIVKTLRGFDLKPAGTTTEWETETGDWVLIDKVTLEAIGLPVWDHVEECFKNKKRHSIAIKALAEDPLTTDAQKNAAIEAYDFTTGWPE
ncbi:MAG: DUF4376 domain-containing protein [Smithella sp.]